MKTHAGRHEVTWSQSEHRLLQTGGSVASIMKTLSGHTNTLKSNWNNETPSLTYWSPWRHLHSQRTLAGVLVPDGTQWDSCWRKGCRRMCMYSNVVLSNVPNNALLSRSDETTGQSNPLLWWIFTLERLGYILLIKWSATYYCDESSFKKF